MQIMEDSGIVALFHQRDQRAIKETEQKYGSLGMKMAQNLTGSQQDAEECLNDALLRVWNAIPPANPENYCAYLLKTVRNAALDRYKSRRRGKRGGGQISQALDELTEIFPASENVEQELEQRELMRAVTAFLQNLPEKQCSLFICRYWQSAAITDLAKRFGMTENHVKVTLARMRKRLQNYLREEGLL